MEFGGWRRLLFIIEAFAEVNGRKILNFARRPFLQVLVQISASYFVISLDTNPHNSKFNMSHTEERPAPLRLGSVAPNFQAETTNGPIDFHEFVGDKWVVLFSHPEDYTPVCTTELGAFAKLEPEFTKRGVKLIGLSANTVDSHGGWIKDIDEISGSKLRFPIIGDKERKVAYLYDMLDHQDTTNVDQKGIAFTIRSVFIVDPKKTIRLIMSYPASTGRNAAEVLRVVDSLQTGDKHRVTTPINWIPGDDVIVHPSVKGEEATKLFPNMRVVKPYLRFTPLPKEQTSAAV